MDLAITDFLGLAAGGATTTGFYYTLGAVGSSSPNKSISSSSFLGAAFLASSTTGFATSDLGYYG